LRIRSSVRSMHSFPATQTDSVFIVTILKWVLSVSKWSDVKCSDVEWTDKIYVKWFCFEVKWVMVKFLWTKVPCTLQWLFCLSHFLKIFSWFCFVSLYIWAGIAQSV
jgi:hypothetical protein